MTTDTNVAPWWRVPRSHGVIVGGLLLLLGLWGGLAPFIGPYANFGYTPSSPWAFTWGRLWLEIVPAVVTLLAAFALLFSGNRVIGVWMSLLAVLAGAWFIIGGSVSRLWHSGTSQAGSPTGDTLAQVMQQIGLFTGLGMVIVFLAAVALTRFTFTTARPRRARTDRAEMATYPESPTTAHTAEPTHTTAPTTEPTHTAEPTPATAPTTETAPASSADEEPRR